MSPSKPLRRRRSDWTIAAAILIAGLMISASIFATRVSTSAAKPVNDFAAPIVGTPENFQISVPRGCTPEQRQEVLERWEEMWKLELLEDETNDGPSYRVHGGVI